jgi:hypothetical protein
MPLFMDVHNIEGGVSAADAAGAHEADLATQGEYGVSYLRYWVDEEAGKIFCLVDAPDGGMRELTLRSLRYGAALGREGDGAAAAVLADELAECR